jgi:hypothetical protein
MTNRFYVIINLSDIFDFNERAGFVLCTNLLQAFFFFIKKKIELFFKFILMNLVTIYKCCWYDVVEMGMEK